VTFTGFICALASLVWLRAVQDRHTDRHTDNSSTIYKISLSLTLVLLLRVSWKRLHVVLHVFDWIRVTDKTFSSYCLISFGKLCDSVNYVHWDSDIKMSKPCYLTERMLAITSESCVMSGYLVCFTRRIVEVQGDPLRRSPSAIDLAPTPRYAPVTSDITLLLLLPRILHLASSEQWCWSGGRGILTELFLCCSLVLHFSNARCTIIMSSSFRLVYWIGLDLIRPSSQSSTHLCIFGLYGAM